MKIIKQYPVSIWHHVIIRDNGKGEFEIPTIDDNVTK